MKKCLTLVAALAAICIVPSFAVADYAGEPDDYPPGVQPGAAWMELHQAPRLLDATTAQNPDEVGCWEYVYDVWGGYDTFLKDVNLYYDASLQVNLWDYNDQTPWEPGDSAISQIWGSQSAGLGIPNNGYKAPDEWPSNWKADPLTFQMHWEVTDRVWGMENTYHPGSDYHSDYHVWRGLNVFDDYINIHNTNGTLWFGGWAVEGLSLTYRVVHPYAPGDMLYAIGQAPGHSDYILGPVVGGDDGRLGDFDGDGDIDADDIDALGAAIQAGSSDLEFDMDGDGDVDADDFNMHVTTLVDTALGEGTGTAFGDFNLDGVVGILDLGLLGDGYNAAGGWASGDANGDGSIGILDLGLLGDNYGYDGSAIPEPATMSLLGLGAVAILRRRSR
jgi:hypothetical protein